MLTDQLRCLVHPMQPDQRIENEQARLACLDGVAESLPVLRSVQAERRGGDHLDWQRLEADAGRRANSLQAPAHHRQGVFGGKKEYGSGASDNKLAQQGAPEATLTARSRARKLLQHLGSPPRMPTAWLDQSPWTSHWVSEAESIESPLARWTGSWFMSVWSSVWGSRVKTSKKSFSSNVRGLFLPVLGSQTHIPRIVAGTLLGRRIQN